MYADACAQRASVENSIHLASKSASVGASQTVVIAANTGFQSSSLIPGILQFLTMFLLMCQRQIMLAASGNVVFKAVMMAFSRSVKATLGGWMSCLRKVLAMALSPQA